MTSTEPVPGGEVAVIWLSFTTLTAVAAAAPKLTPVAPVKPPPVIVTAVPPPVPPVFGLTPDTVGTVVAETLLKLSGH